MDRHTRRRSREDPLPWSFVETGVTTQFLWEEYQKGLQGEVSPPCPGGPCHRCGVCDGEAITLRQFPATENPSSGNRGQPQARKKPARRKVRLRFKKEGDLRFISHLELASLFHRASKRADLSLGYSEGFHPMPRIVFASALPVGVESLAEVVELELEGTSSASDVKKRLNESLPSGIEIIEAQEVPLSSPITPLIHRSIYWIRLDQALTREETEKRIKKALSAEELRIHQERKGKEREVDILPLIEEVRVTSKNDRDRSVSEPQGSREHETWGVELVLRRSQGKAAKPTEIMESLLQLGRESMAGCKVVKIE
jgi:radical SAM-linked protein